MSDSPQGVAQAFLRAINRKDTKALGELMSPGHRFTDSLGNLMEGREKMRAGWAAYFRIIPDYMLLVEELYVNGPAVVMLGWAQGTYSVDGSLQEQNRWRTPAAIRALVEDGLVAEWQVYADNEPVREKMRTPQ